MEEKCEGCLLRAQWQLHQLTGATSRRPKVPNSKGAVPSLTKGGTYSR